MRRKGSPDRDGLGHRRGCKAGPSAGRLTWTEATPRVHSKTHSIEHMYERLALAADNSERPLEQAFAPPTAMVVATARALGLIPALADRSRQSVRTVAARRGARTYRSPATTRHSA
jgi:hypothetical protein